MSAIWALVHFDGQPVDAGHLQRMGAALAPFGPEPMQIWSQGAAGLGHRLLPITPEDRFERQPLMGGGGRFVVVVDGRVDNRAELAQVLHLSTPETREWPDSAWVLRAFEVWGEACPAHLVGALAFVIWDAERQRLFAACTPGNTRPLFYYQAGATLAIATMPRGLLALPFVARALDHGKLASHLLHAPYPRAATFYKDIWRLRSGHTLIAANSQAQVAPYWSPDPEQRVTYPRDDDYVEAFLALFERVIADHLRSAGPVAVMMSGGLDSSTVAATAARQLRARGESLSSYTEVPAPGAGRLFRPNRYADETPLVQAICAQHDNLAPNFVRTDGQWFVDGLSTFFDLHEAPLHSTANLVWLQAILGLARGADQRVILVGNFGNISISWPGIEALAEYTRRGALRRAWHEARALAAAGRVPSAGHVFWRHALLPALPAGVGRVYERLRPAQDGLVMRTVQADYLAGLGVRKPRPVRRTRLAAATEPADHVNAAWSGQFGVDVRDPTVDQRLVEFCLALPPEQYLRDGEMRWLVRRAMRGRLPSEVLSNHSHGSQAADWFQRLTLHRGEIETMLGRFEDDPLARQVLDLAGLRRRLARWPAEIAGLDDFQDYYRDLQGALMVGCYLLWFGAQGGA